MSNDILNSMKISAMGMKAQGTRLRVITENVANADTTGLTPGSEPYHRQIITFKNEMDKQAGVDLVSVDKIRPDNKTAFPMKYIPDHHQRQEAKSVGGGRGHVFHRYRKKNEAERQRDHQAHALGHKRIAKPRHNHQRRAHAHEGQDKSKDRHAEEVFEKKLKCGHSNPRAILNRSCGRRGRA